MPSRSPSRGTAAVYEWSVAGPALAVRRRCVGAVALPVPVTGPKHSGHRHPYHAGMDGPASILVRVWLPDRPGALGLVASRIGAVDGDIVGIDVLERGENVAVDEFAVLLRKEIALDLLVREIEEVDGARVEEVRTIDHFPDRRLYTRATSR